jgi:hypothetical protein
METRTVALRRVRGRFHPLPSYETVRGCGAARSLSVGGPAFGGSGTRPLAVRFKLAERARVFVELRRGARVVRRTRVRRHAPGVRVVKFSARGLRPGRYGVLLRVTGARPLTVYAQRL